MAIVSRIPLNQVQKNSSYRKGASILVAPLSQSRDLAVLALELEDISTLDHGICLNSDQFSRAVTQGASPLSHGVDFKVNHRPRFYWWEAGYSTAKAFMFNECEVLDQTASSYGRGCNALCKLVLVEIEGLPCEDASLPLEAADEAVLFISCHGGSGTEKS